MVLNKTEINILKCDNNISGLIYEICNYGNNHNNLLEIELVEENNLDDYIKLIQDYTFTYIDIDNNSQGKNSQYGISPKFAEALMEAVQYLYNKTECFTRRLPKGVTKYLETLNEDKRKLWEAKLYQCFKNVVKKLSKGIHIQLCYRNFIKKSEDYYDEYFKFYSCVGEEYIMNMISKYTCVFAEDKSEYHNELQVDEDETNYFQLDSVLINTDFEILDDDAFLKGSGELFFDTIKLKLTTNISPCDWFIKFKQDANF